MTKCKFTLPAMSVAAFTLSACASVAPIVPSELVETPLFERQEINVVERAATLEVVLDQNSSQLSLADKARVRGFVRGYNDHGHGPLVMLLPESTSNQQFAVGAIAEAREIAFENGVSYEEISGGAKFGSYPSMVLSYTAYEALAPNCKSLGEIDLTDVRSNSDLPNLGCSVRTNLAAMVADPADLLGTRELDPSDNVRGSRVLEQYRTGEQTGSERNDGESGVLSDVVAGQ